ncbi:transmembrane protein, putative [Medicago truncatula]|uniref:Transmembrane protein, putative n=1 Tax=Medicago truncatula TaxID=3880 RepID=G7J090_MEDTR|nr:transmembrane protein, putative [Medicago truncatula]
MRNPFETITITHTILHMKTSMDRTLERRTNSPPFLKTAAIWQSLHASNNTDLLLSPLTSDGGIYVFTLFDAVVMLSGAVVIGARSSNHEFCCGFCRGYEGEDIYGGGLVKNLLW